MTFSGARQRYQVLLMSFFLPLLLFSSCMLSLFSATRIITISNNIQATFTARLLRHVYHCYHGYYFHPESCYLLSLSRQTIRRPWRFDNWVIIIFCHHYRHPLPPHCVTAACRCQASDGAANNNYQASVSVPLTSRRCPALIQRF